jgi:hypothetical protein
VASFEDFKGHPIWAVWNRADKMPIHPYTGEGFAWQGRAWFNYANAAKGLRHGIVGGIALRLTKVDEDTTIVGLDLDHCFEEGEAHPAEWSDPVRALLDGHYNEVSPSGRGLHYLMLVRLSTLPEGALDWPNAHKREPSDGTAGHGFELYVEPGMRHFTFSGKGQGELQMIPPEALVELHALLEAFAPGQSKRRRSRANPRPKSKPKQKSSTYIDSDDPLTNSVQTCCTVLGTHGDGGFDIVCPWESEHSTESNDTATVYWPAGVGRPEPGFDCRHAHCAHRTVSDLIAWLRQRDHALDQHYIGMRPQANGHTRYEGEQQASDYENGSDDNVIEFPPREDVRKAKPFGTTSLREIYEAQLVDPLRRVDGLIGEGNYLTLIYGPSTAGKSFLAISLVFALLTGSEWFARKTLRCGVLYVALEGKIGFFNRIKAYLKKHKLGVGLPFEVITVPIDLGPNEQASQHTDRIIATIKSMNSRNDVEVGIVIYDNMRTVAPGMRENYSEEVEALYRKGREIANETGASPVFIDNTGKDEDRGARGTKGKEDLPETLIEVGGSKNESRFWRAVKVRDGEPFGPVGFDLVKVTLGTVADTDQGDKEIVSAVVVPADSTPVISKAKKKPLPAGLRLLMRAFDIALEDRHGSNQRVRGRDGPMVKVVTEEDLRTVYRRNRRRDNAQTVRKAFLRDLDKAVKEELLFTETESGIDLFWKA